MRHSLKIVVAGLLFLTLGLSALPLYAQGPDADGEAIVDYVLNTNSYKDWGSWPADEWNDFSGYLKGAPPHGGVVRIYVNDVALDVTNSGFNGTMPEGSIILKENWMGSDPAEPGELDAITMMYKTSDPSATDAGWYWVKASADGSEIQAEGAVAGCHGCHSQTGNADFLLRYNFGSQPAAAPMAQAAMEEGMAEDMMKEETMAEETMSEKTMTEETMAEETMVAETMTTTESATEMPDTGAEDTTLFLIIGLMIAGGALLGTGYWYHQNQT